MYAWKKHKITKSVSKNLFFYFAEYINQLNNPDNMAVFVCLFDLLAYSL